MRINMVHLSSNAIPVGRPLLAHFLHLKISIVYNSSAKIATVSNPFLEDEHIPEIEWTISPQYWGKGYATEIGRAMLAYGFKEAEFPAIMGFALPQHWLSKRVMEKIGMIYLNDKAHQGKLYSFYRIEQHDFID